MVANGSAWTVPTTGVPDFKVGLEYISGNSRAKALFNVRTLLGDITFTHLVKSNFSLGANLLVNPHASTLEKYDFGFNWSPAAGAVIGLKHESINKKAIELGRFLLIVNHVASTRQTVGSEFSLNWATRAVEARLGLSHKFNEDTSAKFKVNHNGFLDAVFKHRINNNVTVSLASGTSLSGIVAEQKAKALPFGVGFDIKF